ncbi:hypothetical protein GCM10027411_12210 [Microbacterium aureliae]
MNGQATPRIIQIAPEIAPGSGIAGVAFDLERELRAAGVDVARFTMAEARPGRGPRRSRLGHAWDVVWFSTVGTRRARRFLEEQPDAISICHNDVMAGDVYVNHGLLQPAMRARGQYVWRMMRNPVHLFTAARDRIRYRGHTHRAVVTLSEDETRRLRETYGRVAPAVTVIPNGVDLARFRPPTPVERARSRDVVGVSGDAPVAVFIGHEFDRKGLPLVLDAMTMEQLSDLRLVVVGGTSDEVRHGARLARHRGLTDRVQFAGVQPDPVPYLWAGDLFVLPSAYESSGLVFLEALATGLPVVATGVGVAPERIRDHENGMLVERAATAVGAGIAAVLHLDPAIVRDAARNSVADLGWQGVAARYAALADALATRPEPERIVHAIRSDGFSGVERYVVQLATAQAQAGHTVTVIGGDPHRMRDALKTSGIPHHPARTTLQVARALRVAGRGVDVVNTHMTAAELGARLAFGWSRRRPTVVSTRHFARRRGRIGPIALDALVTPVIDAEIAISSAVASATATRTTVVPTGLPDHTPPPRARAAVVLMAQRLQPEKAGDTGILGFAASGLADEGWRLRIAGDGAERERLEALVRRVGLAGSVDFLGYREDVPQLMTSSSMLLAPCPVEGLGLTVLEAMQAGLPVVAARGGGHVELLDGLSPHALFAPGDPDSAGAALRALAHDPAGRARYAVAAQARRREAYSLDALVEGTSAAYRTAITARRGRGR